MCHYFGLLFISFKVKLWNNLDVKIRNSLTLSIFYVRTHKTKTTQGLKTLQFMKENIILSQLRSEAGNFNARLFKYFLVDVSQCSYCGYKSE